MSHRDVVPLFDDLRHRYPMAAAGLLEQLCSNLSRLLEAKRQDTAAIDELCDTIAACFRPMDKAHFPDSYPWDAAFAVFGRWLTRGLPQYLAAVIAITEWTDDRVETCRARYIDMVRANRDDWNRAADFFERK